MRNCAISCNILPFFSNFNDFTASLLKEESHFSPHALTLSVPVYQVSLQLASQLVSVLGAPLCMNLLLTVSTLHSSAFGVGSNLYLNTSLTLTSLICSQTNGMLHRNVSGLISLSICSFQSRLFAQRPARAHISYLNQNNLLFCSEVVKLVTSIPARAQTIQLESYLQFCWPVRLPPAGWVRRHLSRSAGLKPVQRTPQLGKRVKYCKTLDQLQLG